MPPAKNQIRPAPNHPAAIPTRNSPAQNSNSPAARLRTKPATLVSPPASPDDPPPISAAELPTPVADKQTCHIPRPAEHIAACLVRPPPSSSPPHSGSAKRYVPGTLRNAHSTANSRPRELPRLFPDPPNAGRQDLPGSAVHHPPTDAQPSPSPRSSRYHLPCFPSSAHRSPPHLLVG